MKMQNDRKLAVVFTVQFQITGSQADSQKSIFCMCQIKTSVSQGQVKYLNSTLAYYYLELLIAKPSQFPVYILFDSVSMVKNQAVVSVSLVDVLILSNLL